MIELGGVFSGTPKNPASVMPTDTIRAGEPLIISILAPGRNLNPLAIDNFDIILTTPSGDREQINIVETTPDSGRFVGMINTAAVPPAPVQGDCILSVKRGDTVDITIQEINGTPIGTANVEILIDPFGEVFDSGDGTPVSGTRVTLIDVATGLPAEVFGDDGVSIFPSTVIAGGTATDSGGNVYDFTDGFYRFPFARPGQYRLLIEPPQPYSFPSAATPQQLTAFRRTDGLPFTIVDGSYGGIIILENPAPVRVDVPLDRPGTPLVLTKSASVALAAPGDAIQYRVTVQNTDPVRNTGQITISDQLPGAMRLKTGTVRYNGDLITPDIQPNGRDFTVDVPPLPAGGSGLLTYIAEVRQDAQPGDALNLASAQDDRGATSPTVDAAVRIERDGISERFTLIGRITDGGCSIDPREASGIGGIRVMLQDGTYSVTDSDGRYHFEGLRPGLHVVQIDPSTFPADLAPVDCAQNTRTAGSDISRFVEGRGGALKRADFRAKKVAPREIRELDTYRKPDVLSDPEAAGAGRDWVSNQEPGIAWLFPEEDHNPRVKALRVAIKHHAGQSVELSINGKAVNPLAFDGTKKSANGKIRVSTWRGIEIGDRTNVFVARVVDRDGKLVQQLERKVHYAGSPLHAELLKDRSILIADGVTRPVIAVRLTDRAGKPARNGMVGDFSVPAPYAPAIEIDAQQANQLAGLERGAPVWRVEGEQGIAYIELAPTTAS
ncbi:MAG: hypothetical protein WBM93_07140, partial [Parasphingorhabdus sp.]